MLLDVTDLDVRYGRTHAVRKVTLSVAEGEIVTVLGANGAGKTTLLRAIQGAVRPAAGKIMYRGQDLTAVEPSRARQVRHDACAGRPPDLRQHDRARKSADGCLSASRRRCRARSRCHLRSLSQSGPAARHEGKRPVRWRAADAGDRPRAGRPSQPDHARRALARPVADFCFAPFRSDRRTEQVGHRHPAWSNRTPAWR